MCAPINQFDVGVDVFNNLLFLNLLHLLVNDDELIYTKSALRPIQSDSRDIRLFVCVCVPTE